MINLLRGQVESKTEKFAVVIVNDIGYRVYCSPTVLRPCVLGQKITLFCHLHVREDALELFGFLTSEDLELFELLISISGVGPRMALNILAIAPAGKIKEAIASEEEQFLTRVSGIGSKIAKKVILELKDKLPHINEENRGGLRDEMDALDALLHLGYRESEARDVLRKMPKHIKKTEDIVKEALKYLGK